MLDVDGVVVEGRTLQAGRWVLGSTKRVAITVGAGGCWVEGPRSGLWVNEVATERAELHEADVLSFDDERLRVWPSNTPDDERKPLEVVARHRGVRGLVVQLWWHDQLVEQWRTFDDTLSPPVTLLALAGYESLTEPPGRRADDSYRIFVPEGCEASEPLIDRHATVPAMRPLTITRGDLRLRFELSATERPSGWRRAGSWLAVMSCVGWLLGVCATSMLDQRDPFERMTRHLVRQRVQWKVGKYSPVPESWQPRFGFLVEQVHFKDGHFTSVPNQQVLGQVRDAVFANRAQWLRCRGSTPADQVRTVSWSVGLLGAATPKRSDDPVVSCLNDVLSGWVFWGASGRDYSFSFAFRELPVAVDRDPPRSALSAIFTKSHLIAHWRPLAYLVSTPSVVGDLDRDEVGNVLRQSAPQVEYCYLSHPGSSEPLPGTVHVSLMISPDGRVRSAMASSSSEKGQGLEACVVERARRWIFPRPRDEQFAEAKAVFALMRTPRN